LKQLLLLLATLLLPTQICSLECGRLSLMVKGGVAPSTFEQQGVVWITDSSQPTYSTPTTGFSSQFDVPWTVGGELAWNASQCVQLFVEYAYTGAGGKVNRVEVELPTTPPQLVSFDDQFSDWSSHAAYLGTRYYLGCIFCGIHPFVGFKSGFAVQGNVPVVRTNDLGIDERFDRWLERTQLSAGLLVGLEWWFNRCLSIVLQGEFVASCGPCPNPNDEVNPPSPITVTNISFGTPGWMASWPITLGLRYTF